MKLKYFGLLIAVLGLMPIAGQANQWPAKPIRLLVGAVPGGGTDAAARAVARYVGEDLGQSVVVENRPGASGSIAATSVAQSSPDGYTFQLSNMQTVAAVPHLVPVTFDPENAFSGAGYIGAVPTVLVINPQKYDYTTVDELVKAIRDDNVTTYATSGVGSVQHLTTARFMQILDLDMEHISYKGSGQAVVDLLGGFVDVAFETLPSVAAHIQSGQLRALAVSGQDRLPILPDVPTLTEAGINGVDVEQWYVMIGPNGIPAPILDRLSASINNALQDESVRTGLEGLGMVFRPKQPTREELDAYMKSEYQAYGTLIQSLNLESGK